MAPFELERVVEHPYVSFSAQHSHFSPTTFRHPPYSAAGVPFYWMLRENVEGDPERGVRSLARELGLDYEPRREPNLDYKTWVQDRRNQRVLLDTFFGALRPEESLCFFYAKQTPLSESSRFVIIGVGRVLALGQPQDYEYNVKKRPGALESMLWERNILHSIRAPEFTDGFMLPYSEVLAAERREPGRRDLERYVAFVPDEHARSFAFATEHVSHDGAVAALLACATAVRAIAADFPGPWETVLAWISSQLGRLWKLRGPYPGFGAALAAFGIQQAALLSYEIALAMERGTFATDDPWRVFEEVLADPSRLPGGAASGLGGGYRDMWSAARHSLLKLLSRFSLTEEQAKRWYNRTATSLPDREILANPYLLYERDRSCVDPIGLGVIDRGMFPDRVVIERYPLASPSAPEDIADRRRARAFAVQALDSAAEERGHTVLDGDQLIAAVQALPADPPCPFSHDLLAAIRSTLAPAVQVLDSAKPAYQLAELARATTYIRDRIIGRRRGFPHTGDHDWSGLLDRSLLSEAPDASAESRAREEKREGLRELYKSRISVLIGPAGTGKTTLLRALCAIPEVQQHTLLLAPTGKATVRLRDATKLQTIKTVAQFLREHDRFDECTGRCFLSPSTKKARQFRTVIIDECSMLTEIQLAAVLETLESVERLILVGDPGQLPPIGPGRPFVDIVAFLRPDGIEANFPRVAPCYVELTVPRRQRAESSGDEPTQLDVELGRYFAWGPFGCGGDVWSDLPVERAERISFIRWDTPTELEAGLIRQLVQGLGLDGEADHIGFARSFGAEVEKSRIPYFGTGNLSPDAWQILTPTRSGAEGTSGLNRLIQDRFRGWVQGLIRQRTVPRAVDPQGIAYGDKVLNRVNGQRRSRWDPVRRMKTPCYVANGDLGLVVGERYERGSREQPWQLVVEFPAIVRREAVYYPGEFEGDPPLELAYALTIHKSQGSEFGLTFVVLPARCRLLSRELLYTALTRHQRRIVILHEGPFEELQEYGNPWHSDIARRMTCLFERSVPVEVHREGSARPRVFDDRHIHRTKRGDLVMSKSEVIIADELFLHCHGGLSYVYEQRPALVFPDGGKAIPDFTIVDQDSGRLYYWEHLGMLHDPAYRRRWNRKLRGYRALGAVPLEDGGGRTTLIVTRDKPDGGIDSGKIAEIVRRIVQGT